MAGSRALFVGAGIATLVVDGIVLRMATFAAVSGGGGGCGGGGGRASIVVCTASLPARRGG